MQFHLGFSTWSILRFQKIADTSFKDIHKTFWGTTKKCKNKKSNWFLFQYKFLKCTGREGLNLKFVSDNKLFGRQWSLFSNKDIYNANIKLTDKDKIIQDDKKAAETLNGFFQNAVSSLKLNENSLVVNDEHQNIQDPIEIIVKYQFHPIILIINWNHCKISISP